MLDKTLKDLDDIIESVHAIKGETFCDLLRLHTSLMSLGELTMRLAHKAHEDSKDIAQVKFALTHVHAMVMAELCKAYKLDIKTAQEITDWTDRIFDKIASNQRDYKGKQ